MLYFFIIFIIKQLSLHCGTFILKGKCMGDCCEVGNILDILYIQESLGFRLF